MAIDFSEFDKVNAKVEADYARLRAANPGVTGFGLLDLRDQARKPYAAALDAAKTAMYKQSSGGNYQSYISEMPVNRRFAETDAGWMQARTAGYTNDQLARAGYNLPSAAAQSRLTGGNSAGYFGAGALSSIGTAGGYGLGYADGSGYLTADELTGKMTIPIESPSLAIPPSTGSGSTNIPGAGITPGGRRGTMRQTGTSSFKGGRVKNKQVNTN